MKYAQPVGKGCEKMLAKPDRIWYPLMARALGTAYQGGPLPQCLRGKNVSCKGRIIMDLIKTLTANYMKPEQKAWRHQRNHHCPPHFLRCRLREGFPRAFSQHRFRGDHPARQSPSGEAVLPARPRGQGCEGQGPHQLKSGRIEKGRLIEASFFPIADNCIM